MALKCKYCSGPLELEQRYCPHCGKENELARQHALDMERYKASYSSTQADVYDTVRKHSGAAVRAVILAGLLLGIVFCFVIGNNAYEVRRIIRERAALRDQGQILRQIEEKIAEEDWRGLESLVDYHYLYEYREPWEKYSGIIRAANSYGWIENYVMDLVLNGEEERTYFRASLLSDSIGHFLEAIDPERRFYDEDTEETKAAHAAMEKQVMEMLDAYLDIDAAEWEALKTMTQAGRALFIEEKCGL